MSKYLALLALPVPLKKLSAISGFLPAAAIGQRLNQRREGLMRVSVEEQSQCSEIFFFTVK
jgi:hypothetical protein